jgi:hypothetical protein
MDPYLEKHWRDVHQRLVIYGADQLQAHLPPDLRARVEERVFVDAADGPARSMYPDIRVTEHPRRGSTGPEAASATALAEPLIVHVEDEPATESFIEIVEAGSGHRVVTVVEVLSLANKLPGEGQDLYLRKQRELKEGRVSLVEIDLLRSGQHVLSIPRERIPPSHRTPYRVCVRRGWRPTAFEIYRVPLRERLPVISVPLRESDADAPLDLQALIEQAYRNGRYDDLNYGTDPEPPLNADDAAWADEILRGKGLR